MARKRLLELLVWDEMLLLSRFPTPWWWERPLPMGTVSTNHDVTAEFHQGSCRSHSDTKAVHHSAAIIQPPGQSREEMESTMDQDSRRLLLDRVSPDNEVTADMRRWRCRPTVTVVERRDTGGRGPCGIRQVIGVSPGQEVEGQGD
jgi:hypothetical protein